MLDFSSWGVGGPRVTVPFIFFSSLLLSWVLLGMATKKVGFGSPLSPLRMIDWSCTALSLCHFGLPGVFMFSPGFLSVKGFWGGECADFQGSLQLLTSSHLRGTG